MELKHIALSDSMRQRLEKALAAIKDPSNAQQVLEAFSSAIWSPDPQKYGPISKDDLARTVELSSAISGMANGTDSPALVVDNLPINNNLYLRALTGLSLSINSGQVVNLEGSTGKLIKKEGYNTSYARAWTPLRIRTSKRLGEHQKTGMHSDAAGYQTPVIRILASENPGANPLSTVVAPISEMIVETAKSICENNEEYKNKGIEWVKNEVVRALKAPVWQEAYLIHAIPGKDKALTTNSMIFENPNRARFDNAPRYGLYQCLSYTKTNANIPDKILKSENLTRSFLEVVEKNVQESLKSMKENSAGITVKPGQALLWNDHLALHAPGSFENDLTPTERAICNFHVPGGLATTKRKAQKPGTVPIFSSIQTAHPKTVIKLEQELDYA